MEERGIHYIGGGGGEDEARAARLVRLDAKARAQGDGPRAASGELGCEGEGRGGKRGQGGRIGSPLGGSDRAGGGFGCGFGFGVGRGGRCGGLIGKEAGRWALTVAGELGSAGGSSERVNLTRDAASRHNAENGPCPARAPSEAGRRRRRATAAPGWKGRGRWQAGRLAGRGSGQWTVAGGGSLGRRRWILTGALARGEAAMSKNKGLINARKRPPAPSQANQGQRRANGRRG